MCLAIPGRIIQISSEIPDLKMARVDFEGVIKNICIECVDVVEGDYVLAHAGVALCRVNEEEAEMTISNFRKILNGIDVSSYLNQKVDVNE